MGSQRLDGHDVKRALVRGRQNHVRRRSVAVRAEPVHRGHAPPVARLQPGKHELGHRGDQVVADPALVLEELGSHHRADGVAAEIFGTRVAAAIAVEPRDGVVAARLKLSAENVPIAHHSSIALANPRPVRGHYVAMTDEQDRSSVLRTKMVERLAEERGLSDPRVSAAMRKVPRHVFLPGVDLAEAYADNAVVTRYREGLPVSSASQPAIVAVMLEQLDPPIGGSVLEIGAGTGYNAALLSALVGPSGRVVTIDIDPAVAVEAENHLSEASAANVEVICGDGASGWPKRAPYDAIIVTAGSSDLAPEWLSQLAPAGRLVVPLSIRGVQQCVTFARAGGHLRSIAVCEAGFMPLSGAMANADIRKAVPGHPGVHVLAPPGTEVDA